MTTKEAFTPEEWQILRTAPIEAGALVMGRDPNDMMLNVLREHEAITRGWEEGVARFVQSELIQALAQAGRPTETAPATEAEEMTPERHRAQTLDLCRRAAGLVSEKATREEAEDYRSWVLHVAETVARASREGGFLGLGSARVSGLEQHTLDEIAAALRLV
jgi:hypothetical protein